MKHLLISTSIAMSLGSAHANTWAHIEHEFHNLESEFKIPHQDATFHINKRDNGVLFGSLSNKDFQSKNTSALTLANGKLVGSFIINGETTTLTHKDEYQLKTEKNKAILEGQQNVYNDIMSMKGRSYDNRQFNVPPYSKVSAQTPNANTKRDHINIAIFYDNSTVMKLADSDTINIKNINTAEALIRLDFERARQVFEETNMKHGLRAHYIHVPYYFPKEPGVETTYEMVTNLPQYLRLKQIDNVEIVQVITDQNEDSSWSGLAVNNFSYLLDNTEVPQHEFQNWPLMNFIKADYISDGRITAHEIGHNLGGKHDRHTLTYGDHITGGDHYFGETNYGYINTDTGEYTIMAYKSSCNTTSNKECTPVYKFSTTEKHNNNIIGVEAGQADSADMSTFLTVSAEDILYKRFNPQSIKLSHSSDEYIIQWPAISDEYAIVTSQNCDSPLVGDISSIPPSNISYVNHNILTFPHNHPINCISISARVKNQGKDNARWEFIGNIRTPEQLGMWRTTAETNILEIKPKGEKPNTFTIDLPINMTENYDISVFSPLATCTYIIDHGGYYSCQYPLDTSYGSIELELLNRDEFWLYKFFEINVTQTENAIEVTLEPKSDNFTTTDQIHIDTKSRQVPVYSADDWLERAKTIPAQIILSLPAEDSEGNKYDRAITVTTMNLDMSKIFAPSAIHTKQNSYKALPGTNTINLGNQIDFDNTVIRINNDRVNTSQINNETLVDISTTSSGNNKINLTNIDLTEKSIDLEILRLPNVNSDCTPIYNKEIINCEITISGDKKLSSVHHNNKTHNAKDNIVTFTHTVPLTREGELETLKWVTTLEESKEGYAQSYSFKLSEDPDKDIDPSEKGHNGGSTSGITLILTIIAILARRRK